MTLRVAAVQLAPRIGDVDANVAAGAALAEHAALTGARLIVLPEFWTTGMAYRPEVWEGARPLDGDPVASLRAIAGRHDVLIGGSFLCRDGDGHVRNAFVVVGSDGLVGRHDKDLPTMWERAAYAPGTDDGVVGAPDGTRLGLAMCWELIRTRTVRRLVGRIDLVAAGSAWWSPPAWRPRPVFAAWARRNTASASGAPSTLARALGVPVVHASLCGAIDCPTPLLPWRYAGRFEGPTVVCDASGRPLAGRLARDGPGVVVADVELRPAAAPGRLRRGGWQHRRGLVPALAWHTQRAHGARRYRARYAAAANSATSSTSRSGWSSGISV